MARTKKSIKIEEKIIEDQPKIEIVNLEDVRAVLQTYKGATIYPITIGNIIKDIRLRALDQQKQGI